MSDEFDGYGVIMNWQPRMKGAWQQAECHHCDPPLYFYGSRTAQDLLAHLEAEHQITPM